MVTCLIIAGGEFQRKFASSYISQKYEGKKPDIMIAADRGIRGFLELGMIPDLILGDYDSVSREDLQQVLNLHMVENIQYPPEKNYSDSHLALLQAVTRGATDICLLGVTGSRMDHMLANFGLLKACADRGIQAEIVDATNRIRVIQRQYQIRKKEQHGRYVSVLPYSDIVTGITMTGFRYPIEHAILRKAEYQNLESTFGCSRGISNEITDELAQIWVETGDLLVVESRDSD